MKKSWEVTFVLEGGEKKSISLERSYLKKSFDSDDTVTATVNTIFSIFKEPFGFQTHNSTLR